MATLPRVNYRDHTSRGPTLHAWVGKIVLRYIRVHVDSIRNCTEIGLWVVGSRRVLCADWGCR